jgi:hypothetical protein
MNTDHSLEHLHRQITIRLASALGNLRMLEIGAPFASELVALATDEVQLALEAARTAEEVRFELARSLGPSQRFS